MAPNKRFRCALIPDNYILLLILSIVSTLIVVFTYPVIPERDITFTERWVSGSSQKNLLTKLGGASNCLSVTLSRSALVVRPMFPFNLMFLPEIYDLEHVIARKDIKRIEPNTASDSRSVLVEFESNGQKKRIELELRKRDESLRAVNL